MKKYPEPELETVFTEANKGNEGGGIPGGRAPACGYESRNLARHSLNYLRSVCISVLAAVALLPTDAHAQPIQAWVQRYNGPGNGADSASAVKVDRDNNVIVTGLSYAGGNWDDYATIKYSSAGVPLWTNRFNGPANSDDRATGLAVDGSNSVIVTGYSYGSGSAADYLTIKYSSAGVALWTNRYNGPGNSEDRVAAVTMDGSNNVIVTGLSDNGTSYPSVNYDYLTIKYSSAGLPLWTNRYNGVGNTDDEAIDVAVDGSNNVIVTGFTWSGSSYDCATIEYSSAGVPLWTNRYSGPSNNYEKASKLAVDRSDNVIVTGFTMNGSSIDYLTIKYSNMGVSLWTNRYHGPGNGENYPFAVAVDGNNNVIVSGYSTATGGGYDLATIQYSSAGVPLWTNRCDRLGNVDYFLGGLAVDRNNNAIVTGYSYNGTNYDYTTIAYSSAGLALWTNRYNGPGNGWDEARAISVDSSGNVFVTGSSASGVNNDYATIKYSVVPIITSHPVSQTNAVGSTASFTVQAAGALPLSYQWCRQGTNLVDGGNISGVATTNLLIANVQLADAAGYSVVVTNAYGSVTSSVAQLTVVVPQNPGRFSNLSYSPETGFSFIFRDGTVGQHYRIQTSSSLAAGSWVDWQSFTYNGPTGFMDVGAIGTERRFYRAISP